MFDFFCNTVFNVAQSNAEFLMLNFYVLFLEIVISYVELKKIAFFGLHLFAFNIFEIQTNNVVKDVSAV